MERRSQTRSGPNGQYGGMFPGFSFGLIFSSLGAGEADSLELLISADQKSLTRVCFLYPNDETRSNLTKKDKF